jgi:ribosomal protein S6
MKTYELTYIVSSSKTQEEADEIKKEVELSIQEKGGVIVRSDKTTAQPLAYPIAKYGSGFFSTVEFQTEEKEVKAIQDKTQKNPHVLRQTLVVKKPQKQMKERRVRPVRPQKDSGVFKKALGRSQTGEAAEATAPVSPEDIDKKLDEILGE